MQSVIEIIQSLARQRGRDPGPLLLLRQIDATSGERISHLPVESELSQAWLALAGEPFRPHQAQALMALRRGEPVALRASNPLIAQSAYLLLYATLLNTNFTALLVAPDQAAVDGLHATLDHINAHLPQSLRRTVYVVGPQMRPYRGERLVLATPTALHTRLLRHHDRAWSLFWSRVRMVMLLDIHRHTHIAGAHLSDSIFRLQRIAAAHHTAQPPALLATLIDVADPQPALTALTGQPWRIIAGDDLPTVATTCAVWRGAKDRLTEAVTLARDIQRHGFHIHIRCIPLDTMLLKQQLGDAQDITFGPDSRSAHVLITVGAPTAQSELRRLLRSGYQAGIIVLGDEMHEQMIARHTEALLSDPPTVWTEPPSNAYVSAQHILSAATELPLTEAEVETWGVQDLVHRLVNNNQLVDLPDAEVAWKPTDDTGDPYAEFSMLSASGAAVVAYNEQMQVVDQLDPTGFERWLFLNATLPSGASGVRVTGRDEESGSVTLRPEAPGRRTYPLRRCEVTVRDEHEHRTLGGRQIGWGRVLVNEEVYGYREANAAGVAADIALKSVLKSRWSAPACWFNVPVDLQQSAGQAVGWSLVAALPLRVLATFTDVVPCYDHTTRRLYIVDAQPGGNGLANWLYAHVEEVLPLAYDIALACRSDALFEPLSRVDMDWLLMLLGRAGETEAKPQEQNATLTFRDTVTQAPPRVASPRQRTEFVAGPPPAPQRVVLPMNDERRTADSERRTANSEHRTTSDERRIANDERRTANDSEQTAYVPHEPAVPTLPPSEEPPMTPPLRILTRPELSRAEPPAPTQPPPTTPRSAPLTAPSNRASPVRSRQTPPRYAPPTRTPPARPSNAVSNSARPSNAASTSSAAPPAVPPQPSVSKAPASANVPAPVEDAPDPSALIKRLQRQRQQREAEQARLAPSTPAANPSVSAPVEARFHAGEHIFCMPYGEGEVTQSVVDSSGHEMLTVDFPAHGELQIDPAISLVRKVEPDADEDDDLL